MKNKTFNLKMNSSVEVKISHFFIVIIAVAVFATSFYITTIAQQNLFTPIFLVFSTLVCIVAAYFNHISLLKLIEKRISKRDQDCYRTKMKSSSEFWAFAALISFVPTLVAYGIELDSSNIPARLEKIAEIRTSLVNMKENKYYQSILTLDREKQRNKSIDDISKIEKMIVAGSGINDETLRSIKYASYGVRAIGINSHDRQILPTDKLADKLESLSDSQSEIKIIIKILPLLILLFAIYSVSRKLALAKWEQISMKNKYEDEDKNKEKEANDLKILARTNSGFCTSNKISAFNNQKTELFLVSALLTYFYLDRKYNLNKRKL